MSKKHRPNRKIQIASPSPLQVQSLLELFNQKRYAEAESAAHRLITAFPGHGFGWKVLGTMLKVQGRAAEAMPLLQRAAELLPDDPDIPYNLGVLSSGLGFTDDAVTWYRRSLEIRPEYAEVHTNLGVLLHSQGHTSEAVVHYRQALASRPDYLAAYNNLGNALCVLGQLEEAVDCYRRAVAAAPGFVEAYYSLGTILGKLGRLQEAVPCFQQVLLLAPGYLDAYNDLGRTLQRFGRFEEAAAVFRQALQLNPTHAELHSNLGVVLHDLGRLDEAAACYHHALALKPHYAAAHSNLGNVFWEQGRLDEAAACYRQALALSPDYAKAHNNLGNILREMGRTEEATACYRRAVALSPAFAQAFSNLLFTLNYAAGHPVTSHLEEARGFGRMAAGLVTGRFCAWLGNPQPERLRVGLVSADLRTHPVGYFLEGILPYLKNSRIDLFAYPVYCREDALTARIRQHCAAWRSLVGLNDEAAARLIHSDGIHLLLDLSGHTAYNRLPVFAWKPAPVQASWLGYFATTGLAEMDYILVDDTGVPPGQEGQFTEQVKILSVRFFRFLGSPETATPKPNGHPFGSGRLVFQGRGQLRLLFFLILQLAGLHRNLVQMQH